MTSTTNSSTATMTTTTATLSTLSLLVTKLLTQTDATLKPLRGQSPSRAPRGLAPLCANQTLLLFKTLTHLFSSRGGGFVLREGKTCWARFALEGLSLRGREGLKAKGGLGRSGRGCAPYLVSHGTALTFGLRVCLARYNSRPGTEILRHVHPMIM